METGTLEKKIAKLPDSLKLKVEGYVDALIINTKGVGEITPATNNRGYGSLKGKIWMSEDFNEPLEEKPKLKREFGSLKGFITYIADDFDAPLEDFKDYM
ncbi:MAG TPA: DUF2281 domain-containing protein [Mucilaginibacter sp.]